MKITAISVKNYKRIREVVLKLGEGRHLIKIGGKNAQGKSSLLDAILFALAGKRAMAADPVRHGAPLADVRVEIDGGELVIRRKVKPDGEPSVEVTGADGTKISSPQKLLDGLLGLWIDPLEYLKLKAADQAASLMKLIDGDGAIAKLDQQRAALYQQRTDVGRDQRRADGELERLPEVTVEEPVAVAEQAAELEAAAGKMNQLVAARARLERARAEFKTAKGDVERLRELLRKAEERLATAQAEGAAAKAAVDAASDDEAATTARIQQLRAVIAGADQHNARVAAQRAAAERRARAAADVERHRAEYQRLTGEIDKIDADKAARLAAAALPVAGLGVNGDGVTLNGVPLSQASSAERWRVALGLSIAGNPTLRDVIIRDGALLDDDTMALVAEQAEAAGVQVWIERVGTHDDGVIEIVDGGVR